MQWLEKNGLRYGGKVGILEIPMSRRFQIDKYNKSSIN